MKIIVLRTGDVVAGVAARRGEFERLIRETVGSVWAGEWETVDVRDTAAELPRPASAAAFIVTGSASSVTERAPWMLRAEAYLREVVRAEAPLLGICFGHQLIGQALGGEVTRNPRGREIGTVRLTQVNGEGAEPMLRDLPSAFDVQATHVDSVSRLPPGARVLATTELEPNAIFSVGSRVRCVQFHPEIDDDVMRGYVEARAPLIAEDGLDPAAILRAVRPTPSNGEVLRNFVRAYCASPPPAR